MIKYITESMLAFPANNSLVKAKAKEHRRKKHVLGATSTSTL